MLITRNTPDQLTLRDRTWWLAIVCFGASAGLVVASVSTHDHRLLLTAGLFALFGLPGLQTADVTFDKVRRVCTLRRFDVVRLRRTQFAFADILDVRVERLSSLESDEPGCRLSLVTRSGVHPMSAGFKPDAGRHQAMRMAILDALSVD